MENFKSFAASTIIVEEYEEQLSLISEGVKLDDAYITAPKVTNSVLTKFSKSGGNKRIVTTDGKYTISFWGGWGSYSGKASYVLVINSTDFTKKSTGWIIDNRGNKFFEAVRNGASSIDDLIGIEGTEKHTVEAYSVYSFNPYAKHNFGAYTKTYPYAGYNRIKIEDVFAMFFNNQVASVSVEGDTYTNPAQAFVAFLSHYDAFNGKIAGTGEGEFSVGSGRWAVHVKLDASKFNGAKKKAVKSSNETPEGLKIGGQDVKVGDWLAYSTHYTFLSGANAFMIVGFSGKSTVLVQEYSMSRKEDGSIRTITVNPSLNPVGGVLAVRVGKSGSVKFGSELASLYKDWKSIKFSGSAWD